MSFYRQVTEDRSEATPLTRGPWDAGSQHAGPPAALLGRAIEQRPGARADARVVRLTFDIARPVPIGPLTVRTRVVRAGRRVEVVEADLTPGPATCWMRMRVPLVDGETPSPLTRVLVAADTGPPRACSSHLADRTAKSVTLRYEAGGMITYRYPTLGGPPE